jgi:hypothetical protein
VALGTSMAAATLEHIDLSDCGLLVESDLAHLHHFPRLK